MGRSAPRRAAGLTQALVTFIFAAMEVNLTPDQQALVSDAIANGRLHRPEDAIQQALSMWESHERRRAEFWPLLISPRYLSLAGKGESLQKSRCASLPTILDNVAVPALPLNSSQGVNGTPARSER
jgi:hypothetical protein